ncbi:MAG: YbbR-like domain-containing protein [Christensenellales bacterium]
MPLSAELRDGETAEGYELTAVELAEDSVPVAARQEILDAISELTTDSPLNIDGATEDAAGYVRLKKLTGVENTLPTEIGVTARISEKQIECTLRRLPIQADGVDDSLTATLSTGNTTAQLTGGYAFIEGLTAADVHLFVDVSGLTEGVYTLPVQIHIDNAPEFTCALGSPEVTVTLSARKP